jgi:biotin carboxylase
MPSSNRLLVLGADAGVLAFSAKAQPEIFLVERKDKFRPEQLRWCNECLIADYRSTENIFPLVAAAHACRPFAQVYSSTEMGLVPAAKLNELLGLGGTSVKAVTTLKDKPLMRKKLQENNLSVVKFAIGSSRSDLASFSSSLSRPMIVKPVDSSGSFGVFMLDYPNSERAVQKLFDQLQACGLKEFLMEEFLVGNEISVESFSFEGRHILLACTQKFIADNFVEIGHVVPALLDPNTSRLLAELVPQFLDLMEIKDGPCHTEVMLTDHGPYIIESHNRTGGDHIPQLVEMAVGVQLFELAFGWPIGRVAPLERAPEARAAGAVRFFWPPPGRVVSIQGMEEAAKMPGINEIHLRVGIGGEVPVVRRSADRVGFISARGKTPEEALNRCMRAMREVKIETVSDAPLDAGKTLAVAS